jgi:long-chain fatty acid transport protein
MNCRRQACAALAALGLAALTASRLQASGFAIENQGTRAMGMAGAFVAQASDPSAIFYNAAGVAFLKGTRVYLSGGFGSVGTDFTGEGPYPPVGTPEATDRDFRVLPSLYYTQQLSERLYVGLGFEAPFGFSAQWQNPDQFTGRFVCFDCEIRSWAVNPTIAWRIQDRLSVGIGLEWRWASFRLDRRLLADPNPFPEPTDVAELQIDSGTDSALGFNLGLIAKPWENVSLGLAYRHKTTHNFEGVGDFQQISTGDAVVDALVALSLPPRQTVTSQVTLPSTWAGGIAYRVGDWTIEGDLVWWRWASFDQVNFVFAETPSFTVSLPQEYENTWQGRLGVEYIVSDSWEVRGGISYDRSPQPTPTIGPFLHDEDRYGFGLGASWLSGSMRVDLLARYLLFSNRSTQGLSRYDYNGLYQTDSFQLGIALGYRF